MGQAKMPGKPGEGYPSEGHVHRLWDFQSLLRYRAGRAQHAEQSVLLAHADEVNRKIESYLGKKPSSIKELKKLLAEKRNFSFSGGGR